MRDLCHLKRLHAILVRDGVLPSNLYIGNLLISLYSACGSLKAAHKFFDEMPERDVISYNSMISAYARDGCRQEAIELFERMLIGRIKPNKATFVIIFKACSNSRYVRKGKTIHCTILCSEFEKDVVVATALVKMYGSCGLMEEASNVFNKIVKRDLVCWSTMIGVYACHGRSKDAVILFHQMQEQGLRADKVAFVNILNACATSGYPCLTDGRRIHDELAALGFESDVAVASALVHMYDTCRATVNEATKVFNQTSTRDLVSWNTMIGAFSHRGLEEEALQMLSQMQWEGEKPDKITYLHVLTACCSLEVGMSIHSAIAERGLESDVVVATALLKMYSKCKSLHDAVAVFKRIRHPDVFCWNVMIAAYNEHSDFRESLKLFHLMLKEGAKPDSFTFVGLLDACAGLAALEDGKFIYDHIIKSRFESDIPLCNAIMNMFAKCGSLEDALKIFDIMPKPNIISWNTIIEAYADHGHGKQALRIFRAMQREGIKPNCSTFISVLSACSHAGLVEEGDRCFNSIPMDYGVTLISKHYGCMVDLLGRAGQLDEAENLISKMPMQPDLVIWTTLLGACRIHDDLERGIRAAKSCINADPTHTASYVVLANIYAAAGRWKEEIEVRRMMDDKGIKKEAGWSCIEVGYRTHKFVANDKSHPQIKEIRLELERLNMEMQWAGYEPPKKLVMVADGRDRESKDQEFRTHSERLAVAYGILSTPSKTPLRIIKNLRICKDCHTVAKYISRIVARDIVIRDANRFHHFQEGSCSCADYW